MRYGRLGGVRGAGNRRSLHYASLRRDDNSVGGGSFALPGADSTSVTVSCWASSSADSGDASEPAVSAFCWVRAQAET
jgi:hypothetical protein